MAPEGKSASSLISLPQGGGALHGIGEKFSPDLFTGTGNFTVPIALPPGRNGFQPQLNLVYSSGNGNGPFGLGWSLGIPGVGRKTSAGVPRYNEAEQKPREGTLRDVFILSGAEDLVPVNGSYPGMVTYRPRTEALFAQIERHLVSGNDYWQVKSKDGLVSVYGTPKPKDSAEDWFDTAVIKKPDSTDIFAWKLTETKDSFGNLIRYEYEKDSGEKDGHRWNQPLLRHVRYVDYVEAGKLQFLVQVEFVYDDKERLDPFSDYRAGFEIRTTKLCKSIRVSTLTAGATTRNVREYRFKYENDSYNGVSLLRQIDIIGYNDDGIPFDNDDVRSLYKKQLPPLTFGYTRFAPETRNFLTVSGRDLPVRSLGSPHIELVDLHGAGLPDILEMNGVVRYWRNLGNGRFDLPRPMREAPPHALSDPGVQMIDANGDGRTDLLVTQGALAGYYSLQFGGLWNRRSFKKYPNAPSFNLEDPEVRMVDLTGDGVTDVLRSGTRLECFFNDPNEGWLSHNTKWVERERLEAFPNVSFSDPRVRLADMSGDGLQDIVVVHDGNVEYWPNLGHGNWGRRLSMRGSPRFAYGYDPARILMGDVDGDGLADVVYVDHDKVMLWLNQSGNGWSEPIVIQGTPPSTSLDHWRLVDLYGTGVSGVLWSTDATSAGRQHLMFLDFTGGVKPYVLNEMNNHMGAVTRVEYRPSTHYYLGDQRKSNARWRTPLPFPVQVVAKVEAIDEISRGKLSTEYRYHHGYWDGAEREFRGFGMVEQLDTETFEVYHGAGLHGNADDFKDVPRKYFSKPTLTKTWFHQGPVGEEFGDWAEVDYANEYWSGDPQLLGHTEQVNLFLKGYNDRPGSIPSPRNRRIKRDALRTLRGSILRSELYALDGENRLIDGEEMQKRPYTVTEHAYSLEEIARPPDDLDRRRIFFPHAVSQRTTQWERGDDPMTQFSFTNYRDEKNDFDEFGRPHRQTTVALPRLVTHQAEITGAVVGPINPNETHVLATHTRTSYAASGGQDYIHDRVAQVKSYELTNAPLGPDDRTDPVQSAMVKQREKAQQICEIFKGLSTADVRLIGHQLHHYDGPDFEGLSAGELDKHGALIRTETLAFTGELLNDGYNKDADPRQPSYLGGPAVRPNNAPANFGDDSGYHPHLATTDGYEAGYYADTLRRRLSRSGVVLGVQDAFQHETRIELDDYELLPVKIILPKGTPDTNTDNMVIQAAYNYRVLQPESMTEPNGNSTHLIYNSIGLPCKQFVAARGEQPNVIFGREPEISYEYNFVNFALATGDVSSLRPVFVHTKRRIQHAREVNASDEVIESREYSDGFGRLIQMRTQAEEHLFGSAGDNVGLPSEPGTKTTAATGTGATDRVVVSGWQVFDNKGRVVEKYEPFFSQGLDFEPEANLANSVHATLFYDPRGQVIRTLNPDGSEQRVIFGAPANAVRLEIAPSDVIPAGFEPTPWESYTYDGNDLAGVTRGTDGSLHAGRADSSYHSTPASVVLDAMGRTRCTVARNGATPADDWFITRSDYDIRGNLLVVKDAHRREAFRYHYDLLNRALSVDSIDAGRRTSVFDAQGNLIEYRDSKGSLVLRTYDQLNRPREVWARNDFFNAFHMRERIHYGDDENHDLARANNTLNKPAKHYDEAGLLEMLSYDFKGNLLEKRRRAIRDDLIEDWQAKWEEADPNDVLEPAVYLTSTKYDALNRPIEIRHPQDIDGVRKKLTPRYNRAGALEGVRLENDIYVEHIAYNAKGQRVMIAYGNGVMTRHAYDRQTFRLSRLRTERFTHPNGDRMVFEPNGDPLQDFTYTYDLAGNITAIEERVPHCGFSANPDAVLVSDPTLAGLVAAGDALVRSFKYDPVYRLTSATGRACREIHPPRGLDDDPRGGFYAGGPPTPTPENAHEITEGYVEEYTYDPAGNMLTMAHQSGMKAQWTRVFGMDGLPSTESTNALNNRLTSLDDQALPFNYEFDPNGNLIRQNTERRHTWDHADRMIGYRVQPNANSPASITARYLYGADGMRVKKWVRNQQRQINSTVYIDGIFEHHRQINGQATIENNTLHVMDNQSRIALVRVGVPLDPRDASPIVSYHLGDHLGSSAVVVGGDNSQANAFINREEYFPYGETSFGSFAKKRYRYSGKERDEESGLCYYGARYLAPWLARWLSCDRVRSNSAISLYTYAANSPIRFIDKLGLSTTPAATGVEPRKLKGIDKKIAKLDEEKAKIRGKIEAKRLEINALDENNLDLEKWITELDPDEQKKIEGLEGVIDRQTMKILELEGEIGGLEFDLSELGKKTEALIEKRAKRFPKDPPSGGTPTEKKSLWARVKEAAGKAREGARPAVDETRRLVAAAVDKVPAPIQKLAIGTTKAAPLIGPAIGVGSAVFHAREHDYVGAGFDLIGIVPGEGDAFDVGRTIGETLDEHFGLGETALTGWSEIAGDLHDKYWDAKYGSE